MLMKCPKCGFSQPQDQYCAQCGVDMVNFKPPRQSAMSKLFSDPLFHISVLVVVGIVGSVGYYRSQKSSLTKRVTYLRGGNQLPRQVANDNPSETPKAENLLASSEEASASAMGQNSRSTSGSVDAIGATAKIGSQQTSEVSIPASDLAPKSAASDEDKIGHGPKKSPGSTNAVASKGQSLYKVKVSYYEMSQRSFEALIEESSKSGQFNNFGDYSAGIIPQAQKRILGLSKDANVLRSDADPIELGKPLNWSLNARVSEREPASQEVTYSTFINLEDVDNQIFKGNLEIVRSQKEPSEAGGTSIQKSNFPAVFEIAQDAAFFMSGLGSHRTDGSKSDNEFVVVVQFEKN